MAEKLLLEAQIEELSELKTSKPTEKYPAGNKYFTINNGQFVCFNESMHAVFANLQGQSVKLNCTKALEGKSTRIDSLALPEAEAPVPETGTQGPKVGTSTGYKADPAKTGSIEAQVAVKEVMECWRLGKLPDDSPLLLAAKQWCMVAIGMDK